MGSAALLRQQTWGTHVGSCRQLGMGFMMLFGAVVLFLLVWFAAQAVRGHGRPCNVVAAHATGPVDRQPGDLPSALFQQMARLGGGRMLDPDGDDVAPCGGRTPLLPVSRGCWTPSPRR
jgi:hypothetical protein